MYLRPHGNSRWTCNLPELVAQLHASAVRLVSWRSAAGRGNFFAPVRSKTIAVDPFFRAEINIIGKKPALHVFQATSDDFFAKRAFCSATTSG